MSQVRVMYHLARADFYERVRRYSFLVMLGLVVFLGYQIAIGTITLALGQYRGEFNSAWVGALMSLNATLFIGWFGFFLVTGSVARDRETGVGQIMATTPLTRPLYMLGKWLSNLAVLMAMVAVLALLGMLLQFWKGENAQIDLPAYLAPFLFIVFPLMALVAALAVLFEAIPLLQGGLGNIVYFLAFIIAPPMAMENLSAKYAVFEPIGIGLLESDMGTAVRAVYPDYDGGFSLGNNGQAVLGTFTWTGIHWPPDRILGRFALIGLALLATLLAALFFDRFDPSRTKSRPTKTSAALAAATAPSLGASLQSASVPQALPAVHLTPLSAAARCFGFSGVLLAELRLLLKGQRWWWYAIAGGLILACLVSPAAITRAFALPLAWSWPVLLWSSMGNREARHNVQPMSFSSASPVWRQLPAQWLAGLIVALLVGSGALLRFTLEGDTAGLLALFSGAIFIPSLALASGVWSRTSKLFEILYISMLYIGPFNHVPAADFIGTASTGRPEFFIPLSLVLLACAVFGRARQIRS